jgi:hypothetical protein
VTGVIGRSLASAQDVKAFGNLSVKYLGHNLNGPLFVINKMLPGECESREVLIKNNGSVSSRVYIRAVSLSDQISSQIQISVFSDDQQLRSYSLTSFFGESATSSGILLDQMTPGESKEVRISACLSPSTGNVFELKQVRFDLTFSEVVDRFSLPTECDELKNKITRKIEGSDRSDRIKGGHENEYILGKAGNDKIDGGGGDDCIVAGDGDDEVEAGNGEDIVLGGRGRDKLYGGNGKDKLYGEQDEDKIDGGNSKDTCRSGEHYKNCDL